MVFIFLLYLFPPTHFSMNKYIGGIAIGTDIVMGFKSIISKSIDSFLEPRFVFLLIIFNKIAWKKEVGHITTLILNKQPIIK